MSYFLFKIISCFQTLAGVCRDRSFGGLGDVAVAPKDFARRLFLTADTGDARAPSVLAITFLTAMEAGVLDRVYSSHTGAQG